MSRCQLPDTIDTGRRGKAKESACDVNIKHVKGPLRVDKAALLELHALCSCHIECSVP